MNEKLQTTIDKPATEHLPQSDELVIEGIRRHRIQIVEQKQRDAEEQIAADKVRLKILHDSRPY